MARQQAEARYELAEPERGEEGDDDGHAGQARPAQVCDDASALPHPGREDERVGRQGGVAKEPVEDDGLRLAERGEEAQEGAHHQDVASLALPEREKERVSSRAHFFCGASGESREREGGVR